MSKDTIRNGYIYKITCKKNGKIYIGETGRSVTLRWNDYVAACERGYFTEKSPNNEMGTLLYDMINIGLEYFMFEILEVIPNSTKKDRLKKEKSYIDFYKSKKTENGYNEISTFAENAEKHKDNLINGGKKTRFKTGGVPHNAKKVFATNLNDGNIMQFASYNEATRFVVDNILNDTTKFYVANRLIRLASKQNQEYCNFKWETALDTDYGIKPYDISRTNQHGSTVCLNGEKFINKKGFEFEIIEVLKENKRKVRFTNSGYETIAATKEILNGSLKDWYAPSVCGIGIIGLEINTPQSHPLYDKWRGILRRCSSNVDINICDRWILFSNFVNDISLKASEIDVYDLNNITLSIDRNSNTYSNYTVSVRKVGV